MAILLRSATGLDGALVDVGEYRGTVFARNANKILHRAWHVTHTSDSCGDYFCAQDDDLLPIRPDELKEEEEREVTA